MRLYNRRLCNRNISAAAEKLKSVDSPASWRSSVASTGRDAPWVNAGMLNSSRTGNCRCMGWNGSELSDGINAILGMSTSSPFKYFARINT